MIITILFVASMFAIGKILGGTAMVVYVGGICVGSLLEQSGWNTKHYFKK
jgi:hypothetical protein